MSVFHPITERKGGCFAEAFNLIEVVIAMGLTTFSITALIGLLPVALNAGKQASEDTAIAAMTQYVASAYVSRPFATNAASGTGFFAFDQQGRCLTNAFGVTPSLLPTYFYTCTVANVTAAVNNQAEAGTVVDTNNFIYYNLKFVWPWPGRISTTGLRTNQATVSVANFD